MSNLGQLLSSAALALALSNTHAHAAEPDPNPLVMPEVIVSLPADIRSIEVVAPHIVWSEDPKGARPGGVYRVDIGTRKVEALWEGKGASSVKFGKEAIYFLQDQGRVLSRLPHKAPAAEGAVAAAPSSPATEVLTAAAVATQLGVKEGGLFGALEMYDGVFVTFLPLGTCGPEHLGAVLGLDADGTDLRVIARGCPDSLAVSESHVHWSESDRDAAPGKGGERLVRTGRKGGPLEVIARGEFLGAAVVNDDGVFYVDRAAATKGVYRWDPAKKTAKRILAKVGELHEDIGNLYLRDLDSGTIVGFEASGKGLVEVVKKVPNIRRVSVDFGETTWVQCVIDGCVITSNAVGRMDKALENLPDLEDLQLDP